MGNQFTDTVSNNNQTEYQLFDEEENKDEEEVLIVKDPFKDIMEGTARKRNSILASSFNEGMN